MPEVRPCDAPSESLLERYRLAGAYTDCYGIEVPRAISQAAFIEAFCTTPLFKLERLILALFVAKPSTDEQARQLARGETAAFSAWTVEGRSADQLLLRDYLGHTRSWLMSIAGDGASAATARLYFGSAVIPRRDPASGRLSFGLAIHLLGGFHRLYSRLLLQSAARSLLASASEPASAP